MKLTKKCIILFVSTLVFLGCVSTQDEIYPPYPMARFESLERGRLLFDIRAPYHEAKTEIAVYQKDQFVGTLKLVDNGFSVVFVYADGLTLKLWQHKDYGGLERIRISDDEKVVGVYSCHTLLSPNCIVSVLALETAKVEEYERPKKIAYLPTYG